MVTLRNELHYMVRAYANKQKWIPISDIEGLIREHKVVETLQEVQDEDDEAVSLGAAHIEELKRFVIKKAMRLFALLVYSENLQLLDLFYHSDFSDDMFPIIYLESEMEDKSVRKKYWQWTIQSMRTKQKINYKGRDVKLKEVEAICELWQWRFFVPIFRDGDPVYILNQYCPLPFLSEVVTDENRYMTNFSIVKHFIVHRSHLRFSNSDQIGEMTDDEGNPHVAVKELTSANGLTPEQYHQVAENESFVLTRFKKQSHRHLIKAIAYYVKDNKHFFVFPWAKGGNLRDFWHTQPSLSTASLNFSPQDWVNYLTWFFTQLIGLAEAVKILHHTPHNRDESCRHGDLKPENILCFGTQELGPANIPTDVKLVVADAGHARVHKKATELRGEKTNTMGGTIMYSPPEAELRPDEARSRRYDIWSLGCLYLEFLIWILYGNKVLESFRNAVGHDKPYYEKEPVVTIKNIVRKSVQAIKNDPRCSPIGLTALGRLVSLIEDRLLVVKVVIHRNDLIPISDGMESMAISEPSTDVKGPRLLVTRPTIPLSSSESFDPERADAVEMLDEIEKIFAAAKKGSLMWINWDGMEKAARLEQPQILSHLPNSLSAHSMGESSLNELTPGVREI